MPRNDAWEEKPVLPLDDGRVGRRRARPRLPYSSSRLLAVRSGLEALAGRPLLAALEPANQASRGGDAHAPLTRRRTMTEVREGMNVLSADGERLGRVMRIEGDSLLIEKGFFFHKDYACSVNNIREVRGEDVILSLNKIQLETRLEVRRNRPPTRPDPRLAPAERGFSAAGWDGARRSELR